MTTILSKERVDYLSNYEERLVIDSLFVTDVVAMAIELSELRALVANIDDRDTEDYEQCPFCLSSCLETEIRIRHSPDCIVNRYTAYKNE